jgi:hypothetical protein
MRQQERVNSWEVSDGDARGSYPWKEAPEPDPEVRVREHTYACKLQQERCMPDVGDAKLRQHLARP